jgi:hypothetical protein
MKKLIFSILLILTGFILVAQNKEFNNVKVYNSIVIGNDSMRHTTKVNYKDDTFVTKKWAEDSLQTKGTSSIPREVYNTIPITSTNVAVSYGVTMTNKHYGLEIRAWYPMTVDGHISLVPNGIYDFDSTTTGFTCKLRVPEGYLYYDAKDSSGFTAIQGINNEVDPVFVASPAYTINAGNIAAWNYAAGASAETDPTIYPWAKAVSKPTYTYSEVGAAPAGSYLTVESDPKYVADSSAIKTALRALSGSVKNIYSITLPYASSVAGRIAAATAGVDYPSGWTLTADGLNILVTHGLGRWVSNVTVFAKIYATARQQLFNTSAYNGIICLNNNQVVIYSLANVAQPIVIYLTFE